jgi:hypothetical protein
MKVTTALLLAVVSISGSTHALAGLLGFPPDALVTLMSSSAPEADIKLERCSRAFNGLNICEYEFSKLAKVVSVGRIDLGQTQLIELLCDWNKCSREDFQRLANALVKELGLKTVDGIDKVVSPESGQQTLYLNDRGYTFTTLPSRRYQLDIF